MRGQVIIASIVQNRQDAEEVYQDLWVKVFQEWEIDKIGEVNLLKWKARLMAIDRYRAIAARPKQLSINDVVHGMRKAIPMDACTSEEEIAFKKKFWSEFPGLELDDEKKEVFWLHARYGFTYAELKEKLGLSTSTTGGWIEKAREALQNYLNEEDKKHS